MLGVAIYYLVLLGVCCLVANIQRVGDLGDRCEYCDDDAVKAGGNGSGMDTSGESPGGMTGNDLITCMPHLPAEVFLETLLRAEVILCRPGYSSLMDLAAAGRTAILVPTPGQTEQEYLAQHVSSHYGFMSFDQKNFNLAKALEAYRGRKNICPLPFPEGGPSLLSGAIRQLESEYARLLRQKYPDDDDKTQDKS